MHRIATLIVGGAAIALSVACSAPSEKSDTPPAATGAAAGTLAEPNIAEIRSAIDAANQKWLAAMLAGDLSGAIGNYADDVLVMMPGMPAWNGRAAVEAGMKEWLGMAKVNEAKSTTLDVMAGGDLAIETGAFTMSTTMKGGKPVTEVGKYLTVWKHQPDGSWKIIRDINNSDGEPPKAK